MIKKTKLLFQHQGFKKYFNNSAWLMSERALRLLVGLFIGLWVARYLGPERFGILNYAISLVGIVSVMAGLGLNDIVIKELVKDKNDTNYLLGTAFWLKFFGAVFVILTLILIVNFSLNDKNTEVLIFIIASATIFQSFKVIDYYFQSKVLSKYVVYSSLISLVISSIIKIALILYKAPLVLFAWVILFDSFIIATGLVFFYIKETSFRLFKWKFKKVTAVKLLTESWPLMLVGVASMLNMRVDQIFIGNMINNITVGHYAAAVRISELWLILPGVIGSTIYPAIISAKEKNELLYKSRIFNVVKYMSFFAVPFALIVSLFADNIINILYGDDYSEASTYLALYIWTGVPYIVFFIVGQVYILEGLTKLNFYITVFMVVANLTLNSLLIPMYGAAGAAIATLIVAYSAIIFSIFFLYKYKVFQGYPEF